MYSRQLINQIKTIIISELKTDQNFRKEFIKSCSDEIKQEVFKWLKLTGIN